MTTLSSQPESAPSAEPGTAGPAGGAGGPRGTGAGFPRYLLNRASGSAVSLLMVAFSSFFIFRLLPGDPLDMMSRGSDIPMTPERRQVLMEQLGLDQPLLVQFWDYISGLVVFDLGTSYQYNKPVTELLMDRVWASILLSGTALVLCVLLGFTLGALAGWKHGTRTDRTVVSIALVLYSAPTFWLGMIIILVFARNLRLFPVNGMISERTPDELIPKILDVAHHMVLPTVTMTAVIFAGYLLVMRASILDEMGNDYLTAARAKGLKDYLVRRRHAVPNALLPTVTLVFMGLGGVISGALFTEALFSWPGVAYTFYEALSNRDFGMLQSFFVVFSSATVLANFGADIMYWFIDPRARKT